jgi:hypothetical protein
MPVVCIFTVREVAREVMLVIVGLIGAAAAKDCGATRPN